jgi:hypothetical protein
MIVTSCVTKAPPVPRLTALALAAQDKFTQIQCQTFVGLSPCTALTCANVLDVHLRDN